jgi:hypothetical protein
MEMKRRKYETEDVMQCPLCCYRGTWMASHLMKNHGLVSLAYAPNSIYTIADEHENWPEIVREMYALHLLGGE